ncbi:MAG TPA: hypothetical protein VFQ63_02740 [Patescibacteria group bacterium]|nr:hypothetical protein [Patescibacteria group bacterium]
MAERIHRMTPLPDVLIDSPATLAAGLAVLATSSTLGAYLSEQIAQKSEGGIIGLILGVVLVSLIKYAAGEEVEIPVPSVEKPTPNDLLRDAASQFPSANHLLGSLGNGTIFIRPESFLKPSISDDTDNQSALQALFASPYLGGLFSVGERFSQIGVKNVDVQDGTAVGAEIIASSPTDSGEQIESVRAFSLDKDGTPTFIKPEQARRRYGQLAGYETPSGRMNF